MNKEENTNNSGSMNEPARFLLSNDKPWILLVSSRGQGKSGKLGRVRGIQGFLEVA